MDKTSVMKLLKKFHLGTGAKWILIASVSLFLNSYAFAGQNTNSYTREVIFPKLGNDFYATTSASNSYLSLSYINTIAGVIGLVLPTELNTDMAPGDVDRILIMIPPGTDYTNFYVETGLANGVKWGVFDKDLPFYRDASLCPLTDPVTKLKTCTAPDNSKVGITPSDLSSIAQVGGIIYQATEANGNPNATYRYLVLQAGSVGFRWGSMAINSSIKDTTAYNNWRTARPWAGGASANNCDGVTVPVENSCAVFSLVGTASVGPKEQFSFAPVNGSIQYCSASGSSIVTNSTVNYNAISVSGTLVANATPGSTATITCFSTSGTSAKATVTVSGVVAQSSSLTLSNIGATKLAQTTATVSVASNLPASIYYVVQKNGGSTPSGANIKNGQGAATSNAVDSGKVLLTAAGVGEVSLKGLTAATTYSVYLYAEDSAGNGSSVQSAVFQTTALDTTTSAATKATISGAATGTSDKLSLTTTIVPASDATGTKSYYVAALVPSTVIKPSGALFFLTKPGIWTQWTGGALLPYADGVTGSNAISILNGSLNVAPLAGTDIYAGYGIADDYVVKKIYTVTQ